MRLHRSVSIEFNLAKKSRGVYQTKVALLVECPQESAVDTAINRHTR